MPPLWSCSAFTVGRVLAASAATLAPRRLNPKATAVLILVMVFMAISFCSCGSSENPFRSGVVANYNTKQEESKSFERFLC
jgi:hypothetical protein